MECFSCGRALELRSGERVGFRDTCEGCGSDLHVCRNCAHHDPAAYNECREPQAERVSDRGQANRCEYFRPGEAGGGAVGAGGADPKAALDALFKKS